MQYQCPKCSYANEKRFNVQRHIATVHETSDEPIKADTPKGRFFAQIESVDASDETCDVTSVEESNDKETSFKCEKCEKTFSRTYHLKRHGPTCKGKFNPLQCTMCEKIFTCRQSRYKHMKICPVLKNQPTPVCSNCTFNNCTIININVANFDQENIEYITRELTRQCFTAGVHGVNPMIDKIYFNEEHPANHNVQLRSLNHSIVEVMTPDGWVPQRMNNMVVSNSTVIIFNKI